MHYERILITSLIAKRLAGLMNRRRICDLAALTLPAAAGSIAVMPVARRTIRRTGRQSGGYSTLVSRNRASWWKSQPGSMNRTLVTKSAGLTSSSNGTY